MNIYFNRTATYLRDSYHRSPTVQFLRRKLPFNSAPRAEASIPGRPPVAGAELKGIGAIDHPPLITPGVGREVNSKLRMAFTLGAVAAVSILLTSCTGGAAAPALLSGIPWLDILGGLSIAGSLAGTAARFLGRYQHNEGWVGSLARNDFIRNWLGPLSFPLALGYLSLGQSTPNTFVFGNELLKHMDLLGIIGAAAIALPSVATILYNRQGRREARLATEGDVPPFGNRALQLQDISQTYRRSGTAFIFTIAFFAYRWAAVTAFATAAFGMPIGAGSLLIMGVCSLGGFAGGSIGLNALLARLKGGNLRSPFPGFLGGVLGTVALPAAVGLLCGEATPLLGSAIAALAVFASDIHATPHALALHKGQINVLYPDRLVPLLSDTVKKKLGGFYGRAKKILTAYAEKPFVASKDFGASLLCSVFFDPYAYLNQFVIQCDNPSRGTGRPGNDILKANRVREISEGALNEVYLRCQADLRQSRAEPVDAAYQRTIALYRWVADYYASRLPHQIKLILEVIAVNPQNQEIIREWLSNPYSQNIPPAVLDILEAAGADWKGIHDVSIRKALRVAEEFRQMADQLEARRAAGNRLSQGEVENRLLYLCDRYRTELKIVIRKDNLEYGQKRDKNENQSGTRELIGNGASEILRWNINTNLASVERGLLSHIRRKNAAWLHDENNPEYAWHHRTDLNATDPAHIRELRGNVQSHSRDIAFILNDERGNPLALQMKDGSILVIDDQALRTQPLVFRLADGTAATITLADFNARTLTLLNGRAVRVSSIQEYNLTAENKIILIANPHDERNPIATGQNIPAIPEDDPRRYYLQRPCFTYNIDPHEYEVNLDSEFLNMRTAYEYVAIFEHDRRNRYLGVTYRFRDEVSFSFGPGMPGHGRCPDRIELAMAPMYVTLHHNGTEYIIPYLEQKNPDLEPKLEVDKPDVSWEEFRRLYLSNVSGVRREGNNLVIEVKYEYGEDQGISVSTFTLPNWPAVLPVPDTKSLAALVEASDINPHLNVIRHKRTYNWRRIRRVRIDRANNRIFFVYDVENGTREQEIPYFSRYLPNTNEMQDLQIEVLRPNVGAEPFGRYYFYYDTREEAAAASGGLPVFERRSPITGELLGYEIIRFGQSETYFQIGSFDPRTISLERSRIEGAGDQRKLVLDAADWGTKMLPIDRDMLDFGEDENNPNAQVTGVLTRGQAEARWGRNSVLWARYTDPATGQEEYLDLNLGRTLRNPLAIIDVIPVFLNGVFQNRLQVIRKQKWHQLAFTHPVFGLVEHPEWIERTEIGAGGQITLHFRNPHDHSTWQQNIICNDPRIQNLDQIYRGDKEDYRPRLELQEVYNQNDLGGNPRLVPYLTVTRAEEPEEVEVDLTAHPNLLQNLPQAQLFVINPKSAVEVTLQNQPGRTLVVPLADEIDGEDYLFSEENLVREFREDGYNQATAERMAGEEWRKFHHHHPKFESGKIGIIVGPQLSITSRYWFGQPASGIPYCYHDQSIFMAYNHYLGEYYGFDPYVLGGRGGSIQPDKSRSGDGRIRETTTIQNGTPVGRPIRKTLATLNYWLEVEHEEPFVSFAPIPSTITEDYNEGKGIYRRHGHASVFNDRVVAIGAGVDSLNQIVTQRRRWPTSVPIGQYWLTRLLWDEIWMAKIRGKYPSFYTWDQLLHEYNGISWYYCGLAEYTRNAAPLLYFMGLIPYPVDPLIFPAIWGVQFASSMASHIYTMKKVGVHRTESIAYGPATFKLLVPNYAEMLTPKDPHYSGQGGREWLREWQQIALIRLGDECRGQFGVTAMSGPDPLPERYLWELRSTRNLNLAAFAIGVSRLHEIAKIQGVLGSDLQNYLPYYWAIGMNSFWPLYTAALICLGLRLNRRDKDQLNPDALVRFIEGRISRIERLQGLGIAGNLGREGRPGSIRRDRRQFLEELSARDSAEVFIRLQISSPHLLQGLAEDLNSWKLATILENLVLTTPDRNRRVNALVAEGIIQNPGLRVNTPPFNQLRQEAQDNVNQAANDNLNVARAVLALCNAQKRQEVLTAMCREKRLLLNRGNP